MHTDAKRFYAVLALNPDASDEALRLAFRRRAKTLHPDSPTGDAEAFIWLKRAYDTLSDPEQRARYDRACQLPPASHRFTAPPPMPPPLRFATRRRGGMGFARYVVAFVIMAGVSLGGVEAMISFMEAPPSIQTRQAPLVEAAAASAEPAAEPAKAPGSSKSGFWDPTPPTATKP